ncbi:hypothetical protein Nepgr_013426 [Nepenthes gracilis]|uniref:Uncharacterized protein n=1 Tax=Nepenthes gracilis TaxID=150966 RepID=A0AAD3SHF2_NEPGR|nr:hypothetical protein Nepgr_013426 [Nepenthes gracilis]
MATGSSAPTAATRTFQLQKQLHLQAIATNSSPQLLKIVQHKNLFQPKTEGNNIQSQDPIIQLKNLSTQYTYNLHHLPEHVLQHWSNANCLHPGLEPPRV